MPNISVSFPVGSRATRISSSSTNSESVQFEFITPEQENYFITIGENATESPNILLSSDTFVDIWMPPLSVFYVREKSKTNGDWSEWGQWQQFTARGLLNSYEKYYALNNQTVTKIGSEIVSGLPASNCEDNTCLSSNDEFVDNI